MKLDKGPIPKFTEEEIRAVTQALIDSFTDPRDHLIDTLTPCALKIDYFRENLKKTNKTTPQETIIFCFEQFKICAQLFGQFFNYHLKGSGRNICSTLLRKTGQLFDRVIISQPGIDSHGNQNINMGILLTKFPIEQAELFDTIKALHLKAKKEYRDKDPNLYKIFSLYAHQVEKLISIYTDLVEPKLTPLRCSSELKQAQKSPSFIERLFSFFPTVQSQRATPPNLVPEAVETPNQEIPSDREIIRC